jgi:hypothetical protein
MEAQDSATTRLNEYIGYMLPWAHGHQRKAIRDFVGAIIAQQTGCQAQLARHFGNQDGLNGVHVRDGLGIEDRLLALKNILR